MKRFLCDSREQEQDMDVGKNCPGRTRQFLSTV